MYLTISFYCFQLLNVRALNINYYGYCLIHSNIVKIRLYTTFYSLFYSLHHHIAAAYPGVHELEIELVMHYGSCLSCT